MSKKPFDILGLPKTASQADIKSRYRQLALKHHPDRHASDPEDVKAEHEKKFKEISGAYERAVAGNNSSIDYDDENGFDVWQKVWDKFVEEDGFGKIRDLLTDSLKVYMTSKTAAEQYNSDDDDEYDVLTIRIYVSLEDVHMKKNRKVRVNTNTESFTIVVQCGDYPVSFIPDKNVRVNIHLKKHPVYHLDSFMANKDLYCTVYITLAEYLNGAVKELVYLDKSIIKVPIPAFTDIYGPPIWFNNLGLHNEDSLYVLLKLVLPKNMDEFKKSAFLNA